MALEDLVPWNTVLLSSNITGKRTPLQSFSHVLYTYSSACELDEISVLVGTRRRPHARAPFCVEYGCCFCFFPHDESVGVLTGVPSGYIIGLPTTAQAKWCAI